MLKSYIFHSFLAMSLFEISSLAHPNIVGTQHIDCGLDLPTRQSFSSIVPGSSVQSIVQPKRFEKENEEGLKMFKGPLEESNQKDVSDNVLDLSTPGPKYSKLLIPPRSIDIDNFLSSVTELGELSAHQKKLPDDLKETHEMFKTVMKNTDNLYNLLSLKFSKTKKTWAQDIGERLGLIKPYKMFVKRIANVVGRANNGDMTKLLFSVAELCMDGIGKFSISPSLKFMLHRKRIIHSLSLSCETLKDKSLVYHNRLVSIGIIHYLKKYLPQNSESVANEFSHHTLNFQTTLELFFTRDHEKDVEAEIEAPFFKPPKQTSSDIMEYFKRAAFMSNHEECIREGLLQNHPQGIHLLTLRYFLGSQIPRDSKTAKELTSILAYLISGNTLSKKEANYASDMVSYLWKFPTYVKDIMELLTREQFTTNFFKPKAQQAIESFLEQEDKHIENGKKVHQIILGLLQNRISPSHGSIQTLLDEMKSESVGMDEKVGVLHLLNAMFVIQPELRPILFQKIYHDGIDLHVAEVWNHIASQQPISQTPLDDIDTIVFKLHPGLLTASYRKVLGAKLEAEDYEDMKSIGQSLARLPHYTRQDAPTKAQELHDKMEFILSTVPDASKHFGCFEVYLHLLWYNSTFAIQLLESMVHKDYFNDNILFFAERALKNTQETSGIAQIQLEQFATRLKKIHWEIMNALGSEEISPQTIQLWAQHLSSIGPV
ncbi:hypothetical protein DFH28DRAFT_31695 [Melampsora americana]|nr:hypothetical protein DFH28DRAFT_31695 [Melampsora americana]